MNNETKKSKHGLSALLGAAFLMATASTGPGFMTQTSIFTQKYGADFAFVILVSITLSLIAQINVWRIITVSNMRGQDIANKVLPGLGYVVAAIIALGGLAFNIGNVGGITLGLNALLGIDFKTGAAIGGIMGIAVFMAKSIGKTLDKLTRVLGTVLILLIGYVACITSPPVGAALHHAICPQNIPFISIVTLAGGTVGGYITFSGGHRLVDAGIVGEEHLKDVNKAAVMGLSVDFIIRVLLFLAVLGVVSKGFILDAANPAPSAFHYAAGEFGYKIFGLVFICSSMGSVVGASYTSVSFLKTLFKPVAKYENLCIMSFIAISTLILIFLGRPAALLVVAGSLNGLILPITLSVMLIASQKKSIIGNYRHSKFFFYAGWMVVLLTAYMGIDSLGNIWHLLAG